MARSVLVIDNDLPYAEDLAKYFRKKEYEATAGNHEALARAIVGKWLPYHIAVVSSGFPGANVQAIQQLSALGLNSVALCPDEPIDRTIALEMGADGSITRPDLGAEVEYRALFTYIKSILRRRLDI